MTKKPLATIVIVINALMAGNGASAEAGANRTTLEEVVVTARKREEALQTVPLAISAMTGDMLERNNIVDVARLNTQVPALQVTTGSGGNKSIKTFSIRGQSQQELTILSDPSVSVYFGDIVTARAQGVNQAMYDIQSVEVLKGPQGTLFGRNSTGGAVTIKPKTPTQYFEGYFGAVAGSYARRDFEAMVNAPVNDVVQFRVAGKTTRMDGYVKDVVLDEYINTEDTRSARISMLLTPFEGLDSLTVYNRFQEDDGGTGVTSEKVNIPTLNGASARFGLGYTGAYAPATMAAQAQELGIYKTASGVDQFTRVESWDVANTTTYEISDSVSVKNIVGYRTVDVNTNDDTDGLPVPLLQVQRIENFEQESEEFQVFGSTDKLDWIVGLYYFREEGSNFDPSITYGVATTQLPQGTPTTLFTPIGRTATEVSGVNKSKSVFSQGTYNLDEVTEGLSVTVGARYTWDEREMTAATKRANGTVCNFTLDTDGNPATPEVTPPVSQCRYNDTVEFGEATYNLSMEYQLTPDILTYVATRKGYRSGGFGARATTQAGLAQTFEPEVVKDYELGLKANWNFSNGMSARTNLAIYHSDYTDIQRLLNTATVPITTVAYNAKEAQIQGGELEWAFVPIQDLEISGFVSYTDAEYKDFIWPDGTDHTSDPLARAPEHIYSVSARYTLPLDASVGDISLQASYWHTSEYNPQDNVDAGNPVMMPAYGLVNARADWKSVFGSSFDVGLFADNLTDEEYQEPVFGLYSQIGFTSRTPGAPRMFGIDVRYSFGAE